MPTPESANAAAYGSSGGYPANPSGPGQIGFGVRVCPQYVLP